MSVSVQTPPFTLQLGDSRLGETTRELRAQLVFPGTALPIKQEDKTLVWRLDLSLPGRTERAVVKLYRRASRCNHWRGKLLRFRVQREFAALCRLADAAVPCSIPLAWGWGASPEHGRFEMLLTRELPGAVSLKQAFARGDRLRPEEYLPLFDRLRQMHECGVYHGALWPKNILVDQASDGAWQFYMIDLARAVCFPRSIRNTSMARYDLLSLLNTLKADLNCEAALSRYGYGLAEAQVIAKQAHEYRSSRHLRNRLALMVQVRALWARLN